ncbi:uncharacterized protein LOC123695646 [Colias croceus]|uniref:uncharacterized protein LOC123695646 n=1 Tax=Colias crocea TaxID=72248 RepID=UPI001E27DE52|nr:uncharacterized protein LOC123695646 [Colias croceus]
MMLKIILCGLLVAVNGAPKYKQHFFPEREMYYTFLTEIVQRVDVFGDRMDHLLDDDEFPVTTSPGRINGDKYEIEYTMTGLKKDDISVKARQGQLQFEVHSADGIINIYHNRSLPPYVDASGRNWTYEDNVLKIVFPILKNTQSPLGNKPTSVSVNDIKPNVVIDNNLTSDSLGNGNNEDSELPSKKEKRTNLDVEMKK